MTFNLATSYAFPTRNDFYGENVSPTFSPYGNTLYFPFFFFFFALKIQSTEKLSHKLFWVINWLNANKQLTNHRLLFSVIATNGAFPSALIASLSNPYPAPPRPFHTTDSVSLPFSSFPFESNFQKSEKESFPGRLGAIIRKRKKLSATNSKPPGFWFSRIPN